MLCTAKQVMNTPSQPRLPVSRAAQAVMQTIRADTAANVKAGD